MILAIILTIMLTLTVLGYLFTPVGKTFDSILTRLSLIQLKKRPMPFSETVEYIDLGLPSGTKWAKNKSDGFFNWYQANTVFKGHIPSKEDFEELLLCCEWMWNEKLKGWNVIGPNGQEIIILAAGEMEHMFGRPSGKIINSGKFGKYWSSSLFETEPRKSRSRYAHASLMLVTDPAWDFLQIVPNTKASKLNFVSVWLIKKKQK